MRQLSKNLKDTAKIAREFLGKLKNGKNATVIALSGNLGAGKTAFVKAIAKHLKVKSTVNSPTFVIIKKYLTQRGPHKFLYHIDAYRLKNAKELEHLGWQEILKNLENLVFIEWPENVKKAMPRTMHRIKISHKKPGHREFEIRYN